MKIIQIKMSDLKPAEYNPRKISIEEMRRLKKSLKEFGAVQPAVINADNTIIAGHQRIAAAESLGWKEYPCVRADLDPLREKALNLALNKISGEWDTSKLTDVLAELSKLPERAFTGFSLPEIDKIVENANLSARAAALTKEIEAEDEYHEAAANVEAIIEKFSARIRKLARKNPAKVNAAIAIVLPLRRGQECLILADPNTQDAALELRRHAGQGNESPVETLFSGLLK